MDRDPDWTANALFSPSKARLAQAQARDWGFVDTWLAKRYGGKRLPSFERNEETLQALLTLATMNEGAEEERAALEKVEQTALQSFTKQTEEETEDVYQALIQHLDEAGDESLQSLAEASLVLDMPGTSTAAEMASSAIKLRTSQFDLALQEEHVKDKQTALQRENTRLKSQLRDLTDETLRTPAELPEQTSDWIRGSKHLKAKLGEYDERVNALQSTSTYSPSMEDITQHQRSLVAQQERLSGLKSDLEAYKNLPTDAKVARTELERARDELRRLTQKRDRLFEGLVQST